MVHAKVEVHSRFSRSPLGGDAVGRRALLDTRRSEIRLRWVRRWSGALLALAVLYVFIGQTPLARDVPVGDLTGAASGSAANRAIWLALLFASFPVFLTLRPQLGQAMRSCLPIALLLVWCALSVGWAIDPESSARRVFLLGVALTLSVAVAVGVRDLRNMHRVLAYACGAIVVIDLVAWILAPGLAMTDAGLAGIHPQKNTLGLVMLFCGVILAPYALAQRNGFHRLGWLLMFVGAAVLLVASRSKTSLMLLVAFIGAAPIFTVSLRAGRGSGWLLLWTGLLALAAAPLLWYVYGAFEGHDLHTRLKDITFTQRTEIWDFVLEQARRHPVQGVGYGSFWDVDPAVQPSLHSNKWFGMPGGIVNEAHNGYIDLYASIGLLGALYAGGLLLRWCYKGLQSLVQTARATPSDPQAVAAAISIGLFPMLFAIHNFTESSYFFPNSIFGFLILPIGVLLELPLVGVASGGRSKASAEGRSGAREKGGVAKIAIPVKRPQEVVMAMQRGA